MIAACSAHTFKGDCAFVRRQLKMMLDNRYPIESYRTLLRTHTERLHSAVMSFGQSPGFDVYEEEYTYGFDALSHLWDALAKQPIPRETVLAAFVALTMVSSEGGDA